ncbi:hypothetical protein [Candidatus Chloroploca sp. Khr17]|uniref:Cas10/Cmr2 second palm domain-containing protein n=1 Tax=Candidatus Chloroploca sp. Khr17 TaxID=2496869 RepID=UPI00101D3945|nr:hypothetical protein [Candidatus Chloroploca sp. Khr17]
MAVLTGIDLLGIQRYVFASNRLKDVLAASWMVDHVVSKANLIEHGITEDRIILAGGGNAILAFEDVSAARTWTTRYTRWLLDSAPGLEIVVAHQPYDSQKLAWALKALAINLARAKLERRPSAPQLGLSVTESCVLTELPAITIIKDQGDDQGERVSARIAKQREHLQDAKSRWQQFLPHQFIHVPGWRFAFPDDLDVMGRSHGETSLVGVVHIDGNSLGLAITQWVQRCIENEVDDAHVRLEYRAWSSKLAELLAHVLETVVTRVVNALVEEPNERGVQQWMLRGMPAQLDFPLQTHQETISLPIRPILLGGDDLTFVCDGRIALDLAVTALNAFGAQTIPHLGEDGGEMRLTACAGVALVKAHASFYRSYELAERLCASAKYARNSYNKKHHSESGSWLDWHIGSVRPSDTITELRKRQYAGDKLTMRPYPLTHEARPQTWAWLDRELLGPVEAAKQGLRGADVWANSRSRVKQLDGLVHAGGDSIKRQLEAWNVQLPARLSSASSNGFIGPRTPLLDATELLDLHLRLDRDSDVGRDAS